MRLQKATTWRILAHCDAKAVNLFVEFNQRQAETVLRPISERLFQKHLESSEVWRKCFEVLCKAYGEARKTFDFSHDRYGGYCLKYKAENILKKGHVFKTCSLGFLRELECNITELSIIVKSSTGKENLTLGPMRFVNSDCDPNSEYDFTGDADLVRLRTRRTLYPGDEITVKYGANFFDSNESLCQKCERNLQVCCENDEDGSVPRFQNGGELVINRS